MNYLPPAIVVARMQKFGDRFFLAEDISGRHFIIDRLSSEPVRPVIYYEYYFCSKRH